MSCSSSIVLKLVVLRQTSELNEFTNIYLLRYGYRAQFCSTIAHIDMHAYKYTPGM